MFRFLSLAETRRRLPRLLLGLVLCGVGLSLLVRADLGLDPSCCTKACPTTPAYPSAP